MGNMLKAMSMMLISVVGIGVVALAISMEPPRDSIDCEEQICTTGTIAQVVDGCLLYTSPSPRDRTRSRMPSSA